MSVRRQRWCVVVALAIGGVGCFTVQTPPLPSCGTLDGKGVFRGGLTVLPSEVPAITIDSAWWLVEKPPMEGSTRLYYQAALRSTTTISLASFDVQFHSARSDEDSLLRADRRSLIERVSEHVSTMRGGPDSIRPGTTWLALRWLSRPGDHPGDWGCPASVQVTVP